MKPLYDKYCQDGKILFAIGETGNGWEGPIEDRLGWLDQCTSEETAKAMPNYIGVVRLPFANLLLFWHSRRLTILLPSRLAVLVQLRQGTRVSTFYRKRRQRQRGFKEMDRRHLWSSSKWINGWERMKNEEACIV